MSGSLDSALRSCSSGRFSSILDELIFAIGAATETSMEEPGSSAGVSSAGIRFPHPWMERTDEKKRMTLICVNMQKRENFDFFKIELLKR